VTIEAPATARRASYTSAIYGVVSIAAVIVAWEADGNEWHLIEVISGYLLALWLTHSYAALVGSGEFAPWRHVLRHEFPVAGRPTAAITPSRTATAVVGSCPRNSVTSSLIGPRRASRLLQGPPP
jgi:hypothetical protein